MNDFVGSRIGVVTVTYNSAAVLPDFMASIASQAGVDYRIYVVDNASHDGSADMVASIADARYVLIRNEANRGVAAANNQGIQVALEDDCSHVLLLNNDTAFGPELFGSLLRECISGRHAIVVPKIHFFDQPQIIWCAGGGLYRLRGYSTWHRGEGEVDAGQFDTAGETAYAPTCCMLIRSDVFGVVGLMDERYFVYYDDADFVLRCRRADIGIWYCHTATLRHKVSSLTGGGRSDFTLRMMTRNKLYFMRKHMPLVIFALYGLTYALYLVSRWIFGKDSWNGLLLRLRAAIDGARLHAT